MHGAVTIMYKRLEENLQQQNSSKTGISFNKYLRSSIKQEIGSGLTMDDDSEDDDEEEDEEEEEETEEGETIESEDQFDDDINSANGNNRINNNRNNSG